MYAVIKTGGKQYRVEPGLQLKVEKLDVNPGETVELPALLVKDDNGKVLGLSEAFFELVNGLGYLNK